jgi:hypothetical protein
MYTPARGAFWLHLETRTGKDLKFTDRHGLQILGEIIQRQKIANMKVGGFLQLLGIARRNSTCRQCLPDADSSVFCQVSNEVGYWCVDKKSLVDSAQNVNGFKMQSVVTSALEISGDALPRFRPLCGEKQRLIL